MSDERGDPSTDDALPAELTERFVRGLDCFARSEWYDAHEELEEVWSGEVGAKRHLLQALIQLAVALHHRGNGNFGGALSLCERAQEHLAEVPSATCFIEPKPLAAQIAALEQELRRQREAAVPRYDPALLPSFAEAAAAARAAREQRGLPPVQH